MQSYYLIVPLMAGFEWFDEGLQNSLREAGWPHLTRPESMVMMHVQMNIVRPADIARSLRLTRQAVHSTIQTMVKRGIFEMADDPEDGRIRIVQLTAMGDAMRRDARTIVERLTESLVPRIGEEGVAALRKALDADWGTPPLIQLDQKGQGPEEFQRSANKNL
ncbi:MarR family winged helix-turn-helix transcriptional regulator [Brevundimonas sp.]|uniref:MarR family winged helix-turn-helix transcriptional regulator n=1 Tax=Brevundimonas sp. TaxID=1871086 RepID=UPI002FC7144C